MSLQFFVFVVLVLVVLRVAFPDNWRDFVTELRLWWISSGRALAWRLASVVIVLVAAVLLVVMVFTAMSGMYR
jgi:hypothetical protein